MSARRITKELREIELNPSDGWSVGASPDDPYHWNGMIEGPLGTVLEKMSTHILLTNSYWNYIAMSLTNMHALIPLFRNLLRRRHIYHIHHFQ